MKVLRTRAEIKAWRNSLDPKLQIGFVPTMGALHAGHMSLITLAQESCDLVVTSIFVNPLQFAPNEDLAKYPRPFSADSALLESVGVDILFAPPADEIYAADRSTSVLESKVSAPLCGQFRPGHFEGVATVVLKLFNLVQPHHAFFGQKDAQQCLVIERMVRDLDIPITITRGSTLRETDGLAMSSRNVYLSAKEREAASLIFKSLSHILEKFIRGEHDVKKLTQVGIAILEANSEFKIQYYEIRDPQSLDKIHTVGPQGALAAVAAYLGKTRLIDNIVLPAI